MDKVEKHFFGVVLGKWRILGLERKFWYKEYIVRMCTAWLILINISFPMNGHDDFQDDLSDERYLKEVSELFLENNETCKY